MFIGKYNWEDALDREYEQKMKDNDTEKTLKNIMNKLNELSKKINKVSHKYDTLSNRVNNIEGQLKTIITLVKL